MFSPIAVPRNAAGKVDVPMLLLNVAIFAGAVGGTIWLLKKFPAGKKLVS